MYQNVNDGPVGTGIRQWHEKESAQKSQGAIPGGAMPTPDLSEVAQQMNRLREASNVLEHAVSELWRRLEYVTRGPVEAAAISGNKVSPPLDSPHGRELWGAADRVFALTESLNSLVAALRV